MDAVSIFGIVVVSITFLCFTHYFIMKCLCKPFYTPRSIYEESNMNWFGTIFVYILIFPFSFILAIGGFLKWLFTVGRK